MTLNRLFPQPLISLAIVALWVTLMGGITWATVLLGAVLGVVVPWFTARFWPERQAFPDLLAAARLFATFLYDIIVANVDVAKRVLGPVPALRPAFLRVPLAVDDPFVATIFGSMISLTPGTVSVDVDRHDRSITVHILHLDGTPEAAVQGMKDRYEAPLRRIFRC